MDPSISVLIPCYNEELTIAKVVKDMKLVLPQATIYVFDNNSTDKTAEAARAAGALVIREKKQGKGYVVQSMFDKVDSDIYIMVDGDDTYDLTNLDQMVSMIESDEADMVVGNRLKTYTAKSFRPLHGAGNRLVRFLLNKLFDANLKDIMSGLRVMTKAFVKTINITSPGFEVETEMTIKALKYKHVIKELDISYRERPEGSSSKLSTFRDGALVLKTILMIFKDYRPLVFFSILSAVFFLISIVSGGIVINEFVETRYIRHVPLTILASGSMILAILAFVTGVILDSINRRFDELHHFIKH